MDAEPSLGAMLRQAREDHGFTKAEVGRAVGISGERVSQIEDGDTFDPRLLRKFARKLELSADELEIRLQLARVAKEAQRLAHEEARLERLLEKHGRR